MLNLYSCAFILNFVLSLISMYHMSNHFFDIYHDHIFCLLQIKVLETCVFNHATYLCLMDNCTYLSTYIAAFYGCFNTWLLIYRLTMLIYISHAHNVQNYTLKIIVCKRNKRAERTIIYLTISN